MCHPLRQRNRSSSRFASATAATRRALGVELVVLPYQSEPVRVWKRMVNGVPWRAWLEQGVGFLVLWLVHLVGMNLLANAERGSLASVMGFDSSGGEEASVRKRFASYRLVVRLASADGDVGPAGVAGGQPDDAASIVGWVQPTGNSVGPVGCTHPTVALAWPRDEERQAESLTYLDACVDGLRFDVGHS